jgi:hypothetical protein
MRRPHIPRPPPPLSIGTKLCFSSFYSHISLAAKLLAGRDLDIDIQILIEQFLREQQIDGAGGRG